MIPSFEGPIPSTPSKTQEDIDEKNLVENMAAAGITAKTINEGEETEMTIGELFAKLEEMVLENEKNGIF